MRRDCRVSIIYIVQVFLFVKCNGKTITKNDRSSCFVCSISVFEKSKRVAVAVILDLVLVWALFESRQ